MEADRELLELAAKAAGIALVHKPFIHNGPAGAVLTAEGYWSPLTDDGDALRLAVKLDLCVGKAVQAPQRFACPQQMDDAFYEEENGDPYAAARRAIVRAAAAIGKEMP